MHKYGYQLREARTRFAGGLDFLRNVVQSETTDMLIDGKNTTVDSEFLSIARTAKALVKSIDALDARWEKEYEATQSKVNDR